MSLFLSLLPSHVPSETPVLLPVTTTAQALGIVMAYGIGGLDDAELVRFYPEVSEGNPYEVVLSFSDFVEHWETAHN